MFDINKYRKLANSYGTNSLKQQNINDMSHFVDSQYNNSINGFEIVVNSVRGVNCYINKDMITNNTNISTQSRILVDYNRDLGKSDVSPLVNEVLSYPNTIKTGDYITIINKSTNIEEIYLTVSNVVSEINSDKFYMQECNHILKFYNSLSKLIQIPCIAENNLGLVDENSTLTTGNAKLKITISNNSLTEDIKVNKRFIVDHTAWQVTNISKLKTGLIELVCKEIQSQSGDDLINEVPMNEYLPTNISLDSNYNINLGLTLKLNPIVKQGDIVVALPLIFVSDNIDVVTVDNLGNITTVGVGIANITCNLADNEDIKFITSIEVVNQIVVDNFTYDITSSTGNYFIKKTCIATFTGRKYNNSVEVSNTLFDFDVNLNGLSTGAVSIVAITDTYIKVKNVSVDTTNPYKTIFVLYKEKGQTEWLTQEIELRGIYG